MAGVLQTPVIAATRLPRCNQNFFQSQGNFGKDLLFFVYTKEKYLTIFKRLNLNMVKIYKFSKDWLLYASYGDARGSRTLDSTVKEWRLNRLTMAPYKLVFPSRQSGNGFRKLTLELVSAPLILNNYHPFYAGKQDFNLHFPINIMKVLELKLPTGTFSIYVSLFSERRFCFLG